MCRLIGLSCRLGLVTIAIWAGGCSQRPAQSVAWPPPQLASGGDPAATIAAMPAQMPAMLERAGVPGLSMAIVANGEVRWTGGFGVTDVRTKRPFAASTVVEAASLGKPVLATAALALVDAGKLDLDSPIARWYVDPELSKDPLYRRITLRQLLDHTSGLANLQANRAQTIHFPPGDHFSYSGVGYLVAQRVVEKATGEPLDAAVARLVFAPAGMTSSSFIWQPQFDDRTAIGHDASGQPMPKRRPSLPFAAASLQTTAEDYGRFVAALLSGKLLRSSSLAEMWKEQAAVSPGCVECLGLSVSDRSTQVFWGLGWGLDRTPEGQVVWHWGDNDVFRAYVSIWPAKRSGLVFFTNSVNGLSLREDLVNHVAGGSHPDWTFVKYDQYDAPDAIALKSIQAAFTHSAENGVAEYLRQKALGHVGTDESALDLLGFRFFSQRQPVVAVAIWELEAKEFPKSWHAYDSLGLGYKVLGDAAKSSASYRKALEINPGDETAKKALAVR